MNNPNLHISIPKPCLESWGNMDHKKNGKHCHLCNKTVIDFTNKHPSQIIDYVSQSGTPVCGRVNPDNIHVQHFNKSLFRKIGLSLFALLGLNSLFSEELKAQNITEKNETILISEESDSAFATIKGTVKDQKTNKPLDYVAIIIEQGGITTKTVLTDDNGDFFTRIKTDSSKGPLVVKCSNLGFKSFIMTNLPAKHNITLSIYLNPVGEVLMGDIVIIKKQPMINPNGTSGKTLKSDELKRMGY